MFGVSGTELTVILILALVLVGPEKLPEYARRFGAFLKRAKKTLSVLQAQVKSETDKTMKESGLEEVRQQLADTRDAVESIGHEVGNEVNSSLDKNG
ncbi:twin-arginine translocase TatA/TatE family subunit [Bifidobacterium sp. ESL0704]|uniref:Sec-independent protein translocase subunit TatA/TatB n=1 Tax=Bifidobacterium sp. ESL0704 TaxID=2983219 RepID=UPI0023FA0E19|nr:twin-arginine translocase TatA/TatE family subunit [Bifidobacterium sp. ESL0704]WEV53184.1 twin-arginine translocase TatA/TatE family subunit [Bifidobacterium sp. ESL0704]